MTRLPLADRRVLITRAAHQAPELSRAVRDLGGEPVEVPLIAVAAPEDGSAVDRCLQDLTRYRWIVFTSRNAVERTLDRAGDLGVTLPHGLRVAAVGRGTEAALRRRGLEVHLVPAEARWQGLAAALAQHVRPGDRLLLPRSARAGAELPGALRALGAVVDDVAVYRTVAAPGAGEALRAALAAGVDAVVFTSASTVEEFVAALGRPGVRRFLEGDRSRAGVGAQKPPAAGAASRPLVACIGPNTAAVAQAVGLPVDVIPVEAGVEPLAAALAGALAGALRSTDAEAER